LVTGGGQQSTQVEDKEATELHKKKMYKPITLQSTFFEFKFFKKGTMHFKFLNLKHWELLNRAYGKAKGETLPEKL
jgi:hypothetical protein